MAAIHQQHISEALTNLASSTSGLSSTQAAERLAQFGANELAQGKKVSPLAILLHQFADFMIIVLLVAAVISGVAGDMTDAIIILIIVLLNALLGFVQEYRAEKAMDALKKMAVLQAQVLRDGQVQSIAGTELVPGDIVLLEAGNAVPADLRLLEAHSLRIDESALTGESVAVDKNTDAIAGDDVPLGDRLNMAYKATLITNGRGKGVVAATGMQTEIGRIAKLLQEDEGDTPLKKRMAAFGKRLSYIILGICVLLFGVRGTARPHYHCTGPRRCPVGQTACPHQKTTSGRNAGLGLLHLHRQNRHPYTQPHDGAGNTCFAGSHAASSTGPATVHGIEPRCERRSAQPTNRRPHRNCIGSPRAATIQRGWQLATAI